ncbi:aminotransferase class IV [Streptomyces sp. AV19]|uniref:aminotransferase class IV n=1 Tax=Streptomyces sp. AV19 TaxID=2793068 RepID=UPI0018FF0481|nr:aminotransferase class IV [Streptomyces sp. AV19]MBH1938875.1 aminotransferase class IV [Streptomyces sp. AV19]MDG4533506.1 aminotransferase class IV [Streptomyces sp. AV19]
MVDLSTPYVQVNGHAAATDPMFPTLMGGYGHMTAMQIRDGRVRGLDLHLARLDAATRELFGEGLDGGLVRQRVRQGLAGAGTRDASLRVYVYAPDPGAGPETTVVVRPPVPEPSAPQSLRSVPYLRPQAHLKHVGVFGQAYHLRRVAAEGFDEALLVGPDGAVAEGAITNVGFLDGDTVVWPDAPALDGITMLLLRRELERTGLRWRQRRVALGEVGRFDAAFVSNSNGIAPVSRIDDVRFATEAELLGQLERLYAHVSWDVV